MDLLNYSNWAIEQHRKTNHLYDQYIPYEFHLRMVDKIASQFEHLLDDTKDIQSGGLREIISLRMACRRACWSHDTIEDTRISYNDLLSVIGQDASDIVYAVTNEKGKNRAERANDKYYEGIVATPGAVFVKLCDRIANVQYGKMTGSGMYDKYKKENANFVTKLGGDDKNHELAPMFSYLVNLFKD